MTPDVVALTRPLDRVTARIRVLEAEDRTKDAQDRELLALCQPAVLECELSTLARELRRAAHEAAIAHSDALRKQSTQDQDAVLFRLMQNVAHVAADLERLQTEAVRAARIRVESFTARVRAAR